MNAAKNKTPRTKKPKLAAEAAYENTHLVAHDLVERIRELLFDMPAPGNDQHPIHWGHVGDINEVNNRLSSVITFWTERIAKPKRPIRASRRGGSRRLKMAATSIANERTNHAHHRKRVCRDRGRSPCS